MNIKKVTIHDYIDRIVNEGITVLDNVSALPFYKEPVITKGFILCVCRRGQLKVEYDLYPQTLNAGDFIVVYPQHLMMSYSSSSDYLSTLVVLSESFFNEVRGCSAFDYRILQEELPGFPITKEQLSQVLDIIQTMRIVEASSIPLRHEMMVNQLEIIMALLYQFYIQTNPRKNYAVSRKSNSFHEAIFKHFRKQRDVKFYADLLCMSPKHFSTVIKHETGHSPSYWIHKRVIAEAKLLLRTQKDFNIQGISDKLGFEDQATFSRYFKRETGMSPMTYRNSVKHLL